MRWTCSRSVGCAAVSTVVFFHAHPDDEAIFTGGTIARLAARGVRTVVVIATSGEQGRHHGGDQPLADHRADETRHGVRDPRRRPRRVPRVRRLGHRRAGRTDARRRVRAGRRRRGGRRARGDHPRRGAPASALVYYDEGGIYGHADHLAVHRVGPAGSRAGRRHDRVRGDRRPRVPALRRDPPGRPRRALDARGGADRRADGAGVDDDRRSAMRSARSVRRSPRTRARSPATPRCWASTTTPSPACTATSGTCAPARPACSTTSPCDAGVARGRTLDGFSGGGGPTRGGRRRRCRAPRRRRSGRPSGARSSSTTFG